MSATAGEAVLDLSALRFDAEAYETSHILVRYSDTTDTAALAADGAERLGSTDWHRVSVGPGLTVVDAVASYRGRQDVQHAALDYRVYVQGFATPSDGLYTNGLLWGLENDGQGTAHGFSQNGVADADIDALGAWQTTTGSSNLVVAVIDTGVDYTHPDLVQNMWVNPGEIGGNGWDDDGNGYVDDLHGYDFHNNDADPMDDHSHGTHVAGTIAARANNGGTGTGTDMIGVAPNVRVMALKFLDAAGSGSTSNAIRALDYAVSMGARISNNSWGGAPYEQPLADAIQRAAGAGHLFVAAAGNGDFLGRAQDNDSKAHYPSNYQPNPDTVLAVAATNNSDQYASFSNYGATTVDLAAPGVEIWSTIPIGLDTADGGQDGYRRFNGTSMATPHVAGAAALVWSVNPGLSALEVKQILMETVDPVSGRDTLTDGRLNAARAVQRAAELATPSLSISDVSVVEGDSGTVEAVFTVTLSRASTEPVTVNYATADGTAAAGSDYTAASGMLSFAPGVTSQTIAVTVRGDTLPESNESFFVNLSGASSNVRIADSQGQGTIHDDEPSITISDVTVVEGNSGTVDAIFTVTLSRASTETVTISYSTTDGTAMAGSDYTAVSGTLTFAANTTALTQAIRVAVNGDTANESHETFFVNLSSVSSNAGIVDGQGQGTITNDDETVYEFHSTDVPAPLRNWRTTISYLTISQDLKITDLNVALDISHSRLADLDVYLYHPDGSRVALYWGGFSGGNLTSAVFDDEGRQPVDPLSAFDGKSTQGTWQLRVENWGNKKGRVNSWSLVVTSATAVSSAPANGTSVDSRTSALSALSADGALTGSASAPSDRPVFVSPSLTLLSGEPLSSVASDQTEQAPRLRRADNPRSAAVAQGGATTTSRDDNRRDGEFVSDAARRGDRIEVELFGSLDRAFAGDLLISDLLSR